MAFSARARYLWARGVPIAALTLIAGAVMLLGFALGRRHFRRISASPPQGVTVTVVNVGQGEASFVRTPNGRFIVIGGGPPEVSEQVALALRNAGAKKIDLLLLPYPYAEAVGGAPALIDSFPVAIAIEPGGATLNPYQDQTRQMLRERQIPVRIARAGYQAVVDGVRLDILGPADPVLIGPGTQASDNSLVISVRYQSQRFLWAGGIGKAGENALLSRTPNIAANWLRVARSGTRDASSPEFLRLVSPEIVVVSVGPNRNGYPHKETMDRLTQTGARIYRTDKSKNDLRFWTDGVTLFKTPAN